MSQAPSMCENPCETCAKEGLPLLLTRYALMPSEARAPKLTGQLDSPDLKKVPLGNTAHYGVRLLRSGYVYVFDEKRTHWDEYFVTTDGFLSKMPPRIRALKVQPKPKTEFQCARSGGAPLAGVITIRNAKHAGNVWIGFSDVEWTDAVFMAHQAEDHRQKHMKCITVTGGKVAEQPDTAPLEQLEQVVPEFKMPKVQAQNSFGKWCPHAYNSRSGAASALLQAAEKVRPGGGAAIVALHDPVGLAMEIAALMEVRKTTFMNHESVVMPRFAASSIASLESTVKEQAKLQLMSDKEQNAAHMMAQGGVANLLPSFQRSVEDAAKVSAAELRQAADSTWKKYTHDRTGKPRFDHAGSQAWLKSYNEGFQTFDKESIAPLAKAHVAWMQHRCMVSHLSCNYDSADRDSGVAYTATFVELLRNTLDKQPSYELYLKWLNDGDFSENNLAMRAIGFNQTELIDKLKAAEATPLDGRAFPTDAAAKAVSDFMEKMPATANAQLTALLAGLNGPSLKYWNDFHAGKIGGKAAAAMAAVSGKQFVRLPINGNKGQFIQAYMRELYRLDPELRTKPNQLQAAIAKQVKLLEIEGVKMNGQGKLGWYVLLDKQSLAGVTSQNLSGQALADELVKAIRAPADIQKLDMANAARFKDVASGGFKALSGLFMVLNYTKLLEDVEKSMSHQQTEAATKLAVGKIALGGFVAEVVGERLEKLGETRLRNMAGKLGAWTPRALQLGGRFAGFGTGVFLGIWDISKGAEAAKGGDFGLSDAYYVSGTAGIVVAFTSLAIGMGWTALLGPAAWLAWLVLAVGMVVWIGATFFVESLQDNPRQEWLNRCHFGAAPKAEKYPDAKSHVEQYKRALAG